MLKNIATAIFALTLLSLIGVLLVLPAITGTRAVAIKTGSMGDTLPQRSLVYIQPATEYHEGDVVTYWSGSQIVSHRLVRDLDGLGTLWLTQGDNNQDPDGYFLRNEQIIGKAVFFIPYLGLVAQAIEKPIIVITVLLIALAIIAMPVILTAPETQKAPA